MNNLESEIEFRKHICNEECSKYNPNCLCDNYEFCDRAYRLGCHNQFKADFGN